MLLEKKVAKLHKILIQISIFTFFNYSIYQIIILLTYMYPNDLFVPALMIYVFECIDRTTGFLSYS